MDHPFLALKPEYEHRLATLQITRASEVDRVAHRLLRPAILDHHKEIAAKTGVPAVWSACAFEREASSDFSKALGQGDRWDRVSVNVPRGKGPFTSWAAAAIYYEHYDHVDDNSAPWSMAYACWKWEIYNGFGPRNHGRVSGYLLSGTDQYDPPRGKAGKYVADGEWSPSTIDQQLGCVPLALRMIDIDPSLQFGEAIVPIHTDAPPLVPLPTPIGVGGGDLMPTKELQHFLNVRMNAGLKEDGNYGRKTRAAVRAYQHAHGGLTEDGLAGPKTVAAILGEAKVGA